MQRKLEVELIICGLRISQEYQGAELSVVQCSDDFTFFQTSVPGDNCLHVHYRVLVQTNTMLDEQEYVNRVLLEEIDLLLHCLSLFLIYPSCLVGYWAKLDGADVAYRPASRALYPDLHDAAASWSQPLLTSGYSTEIRDDGWPALERLVRKFRQGTTALRQRLKLPLRWFAKASGELSSLDRLVSFWISFNVLYFHAKIRGGRKQIESYVPRWVDRTIAQRYVHSNIEDLRRLSKFPVTIQFGRRDIAEELKDLLATNPLDCEQIATIAALTIYGIRNWLFHGECDLLAEQDKKQIRVAERLLSSLLRELMAKEMLGHALPSADFVKSARLEW